MVKEGDFFGLCDYVNYKGMDVVRRIEGTPTDPRNDRPVKDVTIVDCGKI